MSAHMPFPVVSGPDWPGVRYFCTTRRGGVSSGPWAGFNLGFNTSESPAAPQANRLHLCNALPCAPLWLDQVHGPDVVDADELAQSTVERPAADAALTTHMGRVLAVLTADCLPIVLADTDARVVAVAHAGWRGLASGVLENTLGAMRKRVASGARWRAWVGPGIGRQAFQVGPDVFQRFVRPDPETALFFQPQPDHVNPPRWLADLPGLAAWRLARAGVTDISLSDRCTYSESDTFYSYRRNSVTGRMATLVWLG